MSLMNASKIAVVFHCFYTEQAEIMAGFLKNIPSPFDLYMSAPSGKSSEASGFLRGVFPEKKITIRNVPNRGFDIAPFVCEFCDVYPAYDLVLKIHTKKTPHIPWLKGWGDYLLRNLSGSSDTVKTLLKMFADDLKLGLVYPEIVPALREALSADPWQENWDICRDLAARLGIPIHKGMPLDFPAGSIFWFRPKALESLFELGLKASDFPEGKRIRRNGTLAHAVERLLVLIAKKEGFGAQSVCFEPFKTVRDMSLKGRLRNRLCCEWGRFLDFFGIHP